MQQANRETILNDPGLSAASKKRIKKAEGANKNTRFSSFPMTTLGFCLFLVSFHAGPHALHWFALNTCQAAEIRTKNTDITSRQIIASQANAKHSVNHNQLVQWLEKRQYAALEKHLDNVQEKYKRGEINDLALRAAFRGFYDPDPALAPQFADWIKTYPHSYVARLAEGIYYIHVGRKARGDKYINETTKAQIRGMNRANRRAIDALISSVKLDKKPLLSYYWLIDISRNYNSAKPFRAFSGYSRHIGNKESHKGLFSGHRPVSQRDLIDAANRIAPQNFIARWKYMNILETRWGHSTREMIAFLHECRSAPLPPAQMKILEAAIERDKAWNADIHGDLKSAAKHYAAAVDLVKNDETLLEEAGYEYEKLNRYDLAEKYFTRAVKIAPSNERYLEETGYAYEKLHRYGLAEKYFTRAVKIKPNDAYSWTNLGYCQFMLKNMPAAARAYRKGAELGNPSAQDEWGKLLWYGTTVPQDCSAAINWFKKAAAKGIADAKNNLYWSRRKFETHCKTAASSSRQ